MDENISFEDLGLDEQCLAAVAKKGFETPSPIQILAIPRLLEGDANLIARARTGTGKTAAFGLPLVQKIREDKGYPQALILTPTRELCMQVCREIESFTPGYDMETKTRDIDAVPRLTAVYGGSAYGSQLKDLRRGVEIVVGTPGRVQDHLERGSLRLENISYFILDEADEMLDMGFIDDIEHIFEQANKDSRILLFSATMPPEILKIAGKFMGDYEIIEEEAKPEEPLLTEQHYWTVREREKIEALVRLIDMSPDFYGLIFTQTKMDADNVSKQLDERGYEVAALHGDIAQAQREKVLERFRRGKTRILVATDVAARGIDIEGLTHVVNYALPYDGPTYVHRIGRTGRAGAKGLAYTLVRPEERRKLDYIKNVAKKHTKGELTEEEIPTVEEVLAIKRARVFSEMEEKLIERIAPAVVEADSLDEDDEVEGDFDEALADEAGAVVTEGVGTDGEAGAVGEAAGVIGETDGDIDVSADGVAPEPAETAEPATDGGTVGDMPAPVGETVPDAGSAPAEAAPVTASPLEPVKPLPKIRREFRDFARDLCEKEDAETLIARLLQLEIGDQLDPKRYGNVTLPKAPGQKKASDRGKQIRLFVQLGWRDGYNPRSIARYFSDLLNIPGRDVDRIDMSDNFCLVSLPYEPGKALLDRSVIDRSLPHMHIDTKEGGGEGKGRGRGSRDGGRGGHRDRDDRRDFGRRDRDRFRDDERAEHRDRDFDRPRRFEDDRRDWNRDERKDFRERDRDFSRDRDDGFKSHNKDRDSRRERDRDFGSRDRDGFRDSGRAERRDRDKDRGGRRDHEEEFWRRYTTDFDRHDWSFDQRDRDSRRDSGAHSDRSRSSYEDRDQRGHRERDDSFKRHDDGFKRRDLDSGSGDRKGGAELYKKKKDRQDDEAY